jgi:anti-sigma factor (TIGR02949 family)
MNGTTGPDPTTETPDPPGCPVGDHQHDLDCDDAISQLYSYLDGELDAGVVAELEAHLQRCSPCLEAYDFEAELRKVIVARCQEDVPGDLRNRILAVLDRLEHEGGDLSAPGV